jgi:hypothetical protein
MSNSIFMISLFDAVQTNTKDITLDKKEISVDKNNELP